jgi:hypothetical protein
MYFQKSDLVRRKWLQLFLCPWKEGDELFLLFREPSGHFIKLEVYHEQTYWWAFMSPCNFTCKRAALSLCALLNQSLSLQARVWVCSPYSSMPHVVHSVPMWKECCLLLCAQFWCEKNVVSSYALNPDVKRML